MPSLVCRLHCLSNSLDGILNGMCGLIFAVVEFVADDVCSALCVGGKGIKYKFHTHYISLTDDELVEYGPCNKIFQPVDPMENSGALCKKRHSCKVEE